MYKLSSARTLEITIISAEDLRIGRRSIKKKAFVTVETAPNNSQSTRRDTQGGSYPSWYQNLEVELPYVVKYLKVEVNCEISGGVKPIGSVNIPVSDFLESYVPATCLHFLSYRLREHNGNPNGIINLSIRVKGVENIQQSAKSMYEQHGGCQIYTVGANYMQQTGTPTLQQPSYNTSDAWPSAPHF